MTIKDLARESGYSLGTVSRVLNGHPNVSDKARRAVMAVVEAQGFEINSNARNLKQVHGSAVLVVVKGQGNELFAGLVERYQALFSEAQCPLIIDYIDELDNEVRRAALLCREKKPRGILFLGGSSQNFRRSFACVSVPSVLVTASSDGLDFSNLSSVTADDRQGAATATKALLDAGHRELLVLGGDRARSDASRERYEGCTAALEQAGLRLPEERYRTCRYSLRSGYETMTRALEQGIPCTAVFAMADVIAIGAIRAIREHGLRVPEDISVMGYDGLEIGDYLQPRLSTVAQPLGTLAQRSASLLQYMLDGGAACHEVVPFRLENRESVSVMDH